MIPVEQTLDRRFTPRQVALEDVFVRTRTAIALRLRKVCAHFTTEEFDALVHRAATIELKYRALSTEWVRRPDPTALS